MAVTRILRPPLDAQDVSSWVWKKWFNDQYQYSKSGVLIPYNDGTNGSGIQGTLSSIATNRNLVINGDMQVWQRGTNFPIAAGNAARIADRWTAVRGAAVAGMTVSRQTSGLAGFTYCARFQRDAANASTQYLSWGYHIDSAVVANLVNKYITISYWQRLGADYTATTWPGQRLYMGTGTDQNIFFVGYTGQTQVTATDGQERLDSSTLTKGTWKFVTRTFLVPSTATELVLFFFYDNVTGVAAANDYVEITGVQVETGTTSTAFEYKTFGQQLEACKRYYQKSFNYAVAPAQNTTNNQGVFLFPCTLAGAVVNYSPSLSFVPSMFKIPTITFYNPQAANAFVWNYNTLTSSTTAAASGALNEKVLSMSQTGAAGWAVGNLLGVHWSAEGEI